MNVIQWIIVRNEVRIIFHWMCYLPRHTSRQRFLEDAMLTGRRRLTAVRVQHQGLFKALASHFSSQFIHSIHITTLHPPLSSTQYNTHTHYTPHHTAFPHPPSLFLFASLFLSFLSYLAIWIGKLRLAVPFSTCDNSVVGSLQQSRRVCYRHDVL